MPQITEIRRRILLSKGRVNNELDWCLNKMWYNLLLIDENIDPQWKNNMSSDCVNKISQYKELWK